ncbi:MAG: hypothetical protein Q8M31_16915 [Beijerinckiaceae bacterium]|nr:hypothetical protein [Beijerinckiaceae bacterium]
MNIPNQIKIDALPRLPAVEIAALPAGELARLQQETDSALRKAKSAIARLDEALVLKYAERAKIARLEAERDFGIARFRDGHFTIVADLPKRVDWDQYDLASLVERIKEGGEDPRDYVDVTFKVSERKFASWPGHIRKAFEAARTVRPGAPCFKFVIDGEDA